MIPTDEKRWPWKSSDANKEGMLTTTDCYVNKLFLVYIRKMNSSMPCILLALFLSLHDAIFFFLLSQQMRNCGHGDLPMLLRKVCLSQLNCNLTQIIFNLGELTPAYLVFYLFCCFPRRFFLYLLFMITADEKLWPWRSSDVTKKGMLASAE